MGKNEKELRLGTSEIDTGERREDRPNGEALPDGTAIAEISEKIIDVVGKNLSKDKIELLSYHNDNSPLSPRIIHNNKTEPAVSPSIMPPAVLDELNNLEKK